MKIFLSIFLLCAVSSQHFARKRYRTSIDSVPLGSPVVPYPIPSTTPIPLKDQTDEVDNEKDNHVDSVFKKTDDELLEEWLDWALGQLVARNTPTVITSPPADGQKVEDEFDEDSWDYDTDEDQETPSDSVHTPPVDDNNEDKTSNTTEWIEPGTKRSLHVEEVCFFFPGKFNSKTFLKLLLQVYLNILLPVFWYHI